MKTFKSVLVFAGRFLLSGACLLGAGSQQAVAKQPPIRVIFDTDMLTDCDDCGALAVLHKLADLGEADILACVINGKDKDLAIAATVSAINTYYGRPQIPVGTYQGAEQQESHSSYTAKIRDEFPHTALPDDKTPTALSVYRAALAAAPDASVTIISVGFLDNLSDLLKSQPDATSPLPGPALIRAKVSKLVVMGGQFPKSPRREFNFGARCTDYVIANWPTPILFSGFEIGHEIISGSALATTPATNPVRRAYELYGSLRNGRNSWDLTAVLAAVRDPNLYWTLSTSGVCQMSSGNNEWFPEPDRGHVYLIQKLPLGDLAKIFNDFLSEPPTHGSAVELQKNNL